MAFVAANRKIASRKWQNRSTVLEMLLEADGTKEIFPPLACISCRLSCFFKTQQIICQVVVRRAMDFIWNPKPGPGILLVRRGGFPAVWECFFLRTQRCAAGILTIDIWTSWEKTALVKR